MADSKLFVNQYVNLSTIDGEQEYEAEIVKLEGEAIKLNLLDAELDNLESVTPGNTLVLSFVGQSALYKLNVVVDKTTECFLVVTRDSGLERIQRRKYVRVPVHKKIHYSLLSASQNQLKEAVVMDISGGGLQMKVDDFSKYDLDQVLKLQLDSFDFSFNIINGQVIRVSEEEEPDLDKKVYQLGVEFIGASKQRQEEIISWVFEKQRELRQKGII
ncbi:flagellar brake protein [Halanaerobaculum tunisiense]